MAIKRKRAVKSKVISSAVYECNLCEDRKIVERNGTPQKCLCVIKKELTNFQ